MTVEQTQLRNGRDFVLTAPTTIPALWGRGTEVLWAAGEPVLICGPQGVGKGTIAQQLAFARIGVLTPELIGFPVAPSAGRVLYVAADRPRQIARSMRRMVTEADGDALDERLIVWQGPPPFDLVRQPEMLAEWVAGFGGVTDLFVDSLKDIMGPLTSDEVGGAYNRAIGAVIAAGVEVVVNHHQRKATSENKKPATLSDVYGSVWITSGAGSVICLWGQAGDPLVELIHLKQPSEEVGPLDLLHDHDRGRTTRRERPDAWTVLQAATNGGISAKDAAASICPAPSKADIEKVRRRLERFVTEEKAVRVEAAEKSDGKFSDVLYRPAPLQGTVTVRDGSRDGTNTVTQPSRHRHEPVTNRHAPRYVRPPLKGGDRDGEPGAWEGWSNIDLEAVGEHPGNDGEDDLDSDLAQRIRDLRLDDLPDDEAQAAWAALAANYGAGAL